MVTVVRDGGDGGFVMMVVVYDGDGCEWWFVMAVVGDGGFVMVVRGGP